jgi:hypothetical protein
MFMTFAPVASFCVCLRNAAYNMARPVTYQNVFQLHGIVGITPMSMITRLALLVAAFWLFALRPASAFPHPFTVHHNKRQLKAPALDRSIRQCDAVPTMPRSLE